MKIQQALKVLVFFLFLTAVVSGQHSENGNLIGTVMEQDSSEPLGWSNLYVTEINRSATAHDDGTFHLFDLPAGIYHLQIFRVGYHNKTIRIEIQANETRQLEIYLDAHAITTEIITVHADTTPGTLDTGSDIHVSGERLRQNLGQTLAETIEDEPGINQRSMGPAPARPILRGMGGDRLLILEDGQRTGDLSATSADHAVVIEPINSDLIEVIRGPLALTYGSNTLGGVINVSRNYIPAGRPHVSGGSVSMQGQSVNSARVIAGKITVPWKDLAFSLDGSWRKAQDIATPRGKLTNTDIETHSFSAGAGIFQDWGLAGFSASQYNSAYGIPALPAELGGHPGGVDIELKRSHLESKLEFYKSSGLLRRTEVNYGFSSYHHAEYHTTGTNPDRTEFGVLTHNLEIKMHIPECFCRKNGVIGFWTEYRDYASSGLNFTPNTQEQAIGAFYNHEYQFDWFTVGGTIRYDLRHINPDDKGYSVFLDGTIRARTFHGPSAALGTKFSYEHISGGINLFKSLRLPGVEELYSEGPHLAAYAYEIGNPDLEAEEGLGSEVFLEYHHDYFDSRLALFRNDIEGYIFPRNTNQRSIQRNDLYVYRFVGEKVVLQGFEGSLHWHFAENWYTKGIFSYVHGNLPEQDEPIPRVPPFDYKWTVAYKIPIFSLGLNFKGAAKQDRPGTFESPTDDYLILSLMGRYNFNIGKYFNTFSLNIDNITNVEYFNHTNRIKVIMPEPGRNIRLLYRAYF